MRMRTKIGLYWIAVWMVVLAFMGLAIYRVAEASRSVGATAVVVALVALCCGYLIHRTIRGYRDLSD